MLFPGTEMHLVTLGFICIETVILFYLLIHRLARPTDKPIPLNIGLVSLLIVYNLTGGLLPDPNLPGSFYIQTSIAYGTGFLVPCYFPYYVLKAFGLKGMNFHAYRGVLYFLVVPYFLFVLVFATTSELSLAKNILAIPSLYAVWVLVSLYKAMREKYKHDADNPEAKVELSILQLSLSPWLALPLIAYFDLNQSVEAITTNTGFLLLMGFHLKRTITILKTEHQRLIETEITLLNWSEQLQMEVDRRAKEQERITREEKFLLNCKRYQLTTRELEIAQLIFNGSSHRQVAEQLFIAERTVAKHVQNIFEKTSVSNRVELYHKLSA